MRCFTTVVLTCGLMALVPVPVKAQLILKTELSVLCDQADAVVVGRAENVRKEGSTTMVIAGTSYPADQMVAQLAVDKVLKGSPKTGVMSFNFSLPRTLAMNVTVRGVVAGQYGVFFLRSGGDGYQVLDPDYPCVVAFPGSPQTSGSVLDQVTAEVCYVLESREATHNGKQDALLVLRGVSSPIATKALKAASRDPVADVRLSAMALLLRSNDISELPMAENILLHPPSDIDPNALDGLAFAIRFGVHDPKAIPSLARLVLAKNVNVRKGAATALRRTHDSAAIRPLTQALNDTDPDVLFQAVVGLGELTHTSGEWVPGEDLFLKDQKRYLDHWREWAKSQK
jgi:hypothetical protein